ncbi:MAG: Fe-S-cluster containining protein [Pirellulaceae bacterium]|jgi:Fe-S-cluster containining protein
MTKKNKSSDIEPSEKEPSEKEPWYKAGLKFKCSQCGDCCTGAPGYVWVNKGEIEGIATELGMDVEVFEERYVRTIGIRKSLKEFSNGDCYLFDGETRKCTVYESRPRQCKTWPFWDSNLKTPEAWEETCQVCPGSGKGKLYQLDQIEEQRKVTHI